MIKLQTNNDKGLGVTGAATLSKQDVGTATAAVYLKQNGDLAGRFDLNAVIGNNKVGVMVNSEGSITGYCTITGNNFTLSFLVDAETGKFTGAVKYLSENGSTSFLATVPQDLRNTSIEAFKVFANGSSVTLNLTRPAGTFNFLMPTVSVRGITNYQQATITAEVKPTNSTTVTMEIGPDALAVKFESILQDSDKLKVRFSGQVNSQQQLSLETDIKVSKVTLPGTFGDFSFQMDAKARVGTGTPILNLDGSVSTETEINFLGFIPVQAKAGMNFRNISNQPAFNTNVGVGVQKSFPFPGGNAFIKGSFEGQMDDISSSRLLKKSDLTPPLY
jgi:hypothetical protein